MRFLKKGALIGALLLLLGGCAVMTPSAPPPAAVSARTYVEQLNLTGRLSVRYQNNGKDEAMHGNFAWSQKSGHTHLTLLSPLGQTLAVINVTPHVATLTQSGQPERAAANVDALVAESLGWPLPVSGLRDWLQGFAIDQAGNRFVASPQATDVTTRDGWRIRYAAWQDDGVTATRPRRIDLERNTAQAGPVSLRVVIDAWQTDDQASQP